VKTPSPRMRQDNWRNMFSSDNGSDRSYRTFSGHQSSVLCATYSHKGDEVMSSSSDGSVKVLFCIVFVCVCLHACVCVRTRSAICYIHWH
jgi:WD40 repeat protein